MHPSVKISEGEIENQMLEKIMISGATNHKSALFTHLLNSFRSFLKYTFQVFFFREK